MHVHVSIQMMWFRNHSYSLWKIRQDKYSFIENDL